RKFDGFARDETDDFAADYARAVAFGFAAHGFEDQVHRGLFEIGEVDRDLREMSGGEVDTHGLDETDTAVRAADGLGNLAGDADIAGVEVNVVGDQELSCAHDDGAGGRVANGVADVGAAGFDYAHLGYERFELAAADVLEIGAFGPTRGSFVEVNRHLQVGPDALGGAFREGRAVFDGDSLEGDDIRGAEAWVSALMFGEVDQLDGAGDRAVGGFSDGFWRADESEDGAVVVGVGFPVEEDDVGYGEN